MPPKIDRDISPNDAELADAGSRKLFNKPLSDLISDFERGAAVLGAEPEIPRSFFEMLVKVGKRESTAALGTGTRHAVTFVTVHQRVIMGAGALLAALRLFVPIQVWEFPTRYESARAVNHNGYQMVQKVVMGPTLLQVLGIAAVAAAVCVIFPSLPKNLNAKAWVIALEVGLALAMLAVILS